MDMIKKRMAMRGQSGFTLIELLVAVAILAILAGVAVFAVGSLRGNADTAACKAEKDTLVTANAAANASSLDTDTWDAFSDNTPKYFTVTSGGTGNARTITLAAVGTLPADCTTTLG
jgi:prepilin-type N-terminal cleavage/methylation domain-containing protein